MAVPLTLITWITWGQEDLDPVALLKELLNKDQSHRDALAEMCKALYDREPKDGELYG